MPGKADSSYIGLAFVGVYVGMSALREIYFASILHSLDIFTLISLTFLIATLVFATKELVHGQVRERARLLRAHGRDLLFINVTSAVMWFAFIWALKFVEPAVVSAVNGSVQPVAALALGALILGTMRIGKYEVVSSVGLIASIAYLAWTILTGHASHPSDHLQTVAGIGGAIVSGIVTAANNLLAKRLSNAGVTPSLLMATRFWLLVICCGIFVAVANPMGFDVDFTTLTKVVGIAVLGIVIPVYCLQIGISKTDVTSASMVVAGGPLLTFAFQNALGGYSFSLHSLAGIVAALGFVSVGVVSRMRTVAT